MTERRPAHKQVLLRLDPAVHDALARWAGDELRSTNAQIDYLLRHALRDAGRLPGDARPHPRRGRPRRADGAAGPGRDGPASDGPASDGPASDGAEPPPPDGTGGAPPATT
ncbi:hypothetical protein WDH52_16570 [Streptomyces sp. TRM70308]|uniref:hypothetical protein n=1 Tax=Streptomyces sp. TRM70308 TaxID=3131932 RepID=UPI003D05DD47